MEYGLVAALIAFAIVGIITSMGETLNAAFTSINSDLESTISGM
jgi:Flp pilus assembly pilin Flp